jgi:hypothetical protein
MIGVQTQGYVNQFFLLLSFLEQRILNDLQGPRFFKLSRAGGHESGHGSSTPVPVPDQPIQIYLLSSLLSELSLPYFS